MEELNIPMIPLRGMVITPGMVTHFDISREKSIQAIEVAMEKDNKIFVTMQKKIQIEQPTLSDLYEIGTILTVKQIMKLPKGIIRVMVTGEQPARLLSMEDKEYVLGKVVPLEEEEPGLSKVHEEGLLRGLQDVISAYLLRNPKLSKMVMEELADENSVWKLLEWFIANLPLLPENIQALLEERNLVDRYDLFVFQLGNEIQVLDIKDEIERKVKIKVDKNQRDYILREQMKVIRQELGEESTLSDGDEFLKKAKELTAGKEVKEKLEKEIQRFKSSVNAPSENGVLRTYIETMLEMPWDKTKEETIDGKKAKEVLEERHYGLKEVKDRILEFLAVRTLTKKGESPILCLVGPPGTGKTSIVKSLAYALDKPYVRISLGGIRDEAEIRGHRKTYVGAMPGRIAAGLRQAGVKNPVMLLDEIDKVSSDYKGDTFSALLEVLDSEQNRKFRDHYLEVPLDLSEVLFVTTANSLQTIPAPLLDRMELIEVGSYTENEKLHIATKHLIPKQMERHGLKEEWISFRKKAVEDIIEYYTKEAGVRQLERKIGEICRKGAREILEDGKEKISITSRNLEHYLGKKKYTFEMANPSSQIGIVRGLAWTSVGGDTLQIEVNVMPGRGELILTGQLGDVMKESARTGISYIRSVSEEYEISRDFFEKKDIHIHIPEGAVPKDGPSAGITMAAAMISAITKTPAKADVAMTGEITLRGRVLPIGGLKEKLLAAKRAGIKTVLVPEKNKRDVEELSKEITGKLTIIFVAKMEEVLKHILEDGNDY